jgi:hypothetical protein
MAIDFNKFRGTSATHFENKEELLDVLNSFASMMPLDDDNQGRQNFPQQALQDTGELKFDSAFLGVSDMWGPVPAQSGNKYIAAVDPYDFADNKTVPASVVPLPSTTPGPVIANYGTSPVEEQTYIKQMQAYQQIYDELNFKAQQQILIAQAEADPERPYDVSPEDWLKISGAKNVVSFEADGRRFQLDMDMFRAQHDFLRQKEEELTQRRLKPILDGLDGIIDKELLQEMLEFDPVKEEKERRESLSTMVQNGLITLEDAVKELTK